MARCFVIQPFSPEFDALYDDVFAPAVRDAGMEPYRVDTTPRVDIPVENIESGIRDSDACLADITTNNPNVWYELGFAIARGTPVVIVCSDDRADELPFDVQHRNVLRYCSTDSKALRSEISSRLREVSDGRERLSRLAAFGPETRVGNLRGAEAAALLSVASNCLTSDATVHPSQVKHDLEPLGFSDTAISLALDHLRRDDFIGEQQAQDARGERYTAFCVSEHGKQWLNEHGDKLLRKEEEEEAA